MDIRARVLRTLYVACSSGIEHLVGVKGGRRSKSGMSASRSTGASPVLTSSPSGNFGNRTESRLLAEILCSGFVPSWMLSSGGMSNGHAPSSVSVDK